MIALQRFSAATFYRKWNDALLDDQWECIHDTFQYIHEEIIALKYDFEKLLDYLDDEWDLIN